MVDISQLQFDHIRGGSLAKVTEMARGEFGQVSDFGVGARNMELLRGNFIWTIAWEEGHKASLPEESLVF